MTGWTQFTVRFEEEQHADALLEDVEASPHRSPYVESFGNIARVRLLGYNMREDALDLLKSAGGVTMAMVSSFNDTSDGGGIKLYEPQTRRGWHSIGGASCPEVSRWGFRLEVDGLVETGLRAGNDFSLEEQYGESEKEMVPLEEMGRIADETLEMLKTQAQVSSEEFDRNA